LTRSARTTLVVDEIPAILAGTPEGQPPGRLVQFAADGSILFETKALQMPYDAAPTPDGGWLVNIIRARAVYRLSPGGEVLFETKGGGYPCSLQLLDAGHMLVAGWDDDVAGFVREFAPSGEIVWRLEDLHWPWKAERQPDGNTLVADAGRRRVFEVTSDRSEVWAVDDLGPATPTLFDDLGPVYVQRLLDGHTLVSIRGESRVVELDRSGNVVWQVGPPVLSKPCSAVRLDGGNTLVADQDHFRVVEVTSERRVAWELGGFGYPAKAYRLDCVSRGSHRLPSP
jgi:hypothetical protein